MITRKALFAVSAAAAALTLPTVPASAQSDPYLGQMMSFGGNFCPRGWSTAEGQIVAISTNTALFSLLGTYYGGDGRVSFALPDMRGRAAIHWGTGPGLTPYQIGQRGGVEFVTLTQLQMPTHTHIPTTVGYLPTSSQAPDTNSPDGNSLATFPPGTNAYKTGAGDQTGMAITGDITIGNTGGNQSHENRSPFVVTTWCIALQGVYPPRP